MLEYSNCLNTMDTMDALFSAHELDNITTGYTPIAASVGFFKDIKDIDTPTPFDIIDSTTFFGSNDRHALNQNNVTLDDILPVLEPATVESLHTSPQYTTPYTELSTYTDLDSNSSSSFIKMEPYQMSPPRSLTPQQFNPMSIVTNMNNCAPYSLCENNLPSTLSYETSCSAAQIQQQPTYSNTNVAPSYNGSVYDFNSCIASSAIENTSTAIENFRKNWYNRNNNRSMSGSMYQQIDVYSNSNFSSSGMTSFNTSPAYYNPEANSMLYSALGYPSSLQPYSLSSSPDSEALLSSSCLPLDRRFPCSSNGCKRRFARSDELNRHMRTHSGYRPFGCEFCHKRFTRSDHLKTHRRTHTGEKPFSCDFCDKRFARSDERLRHRKTHLKPRGRGRGAAKKTAADSTMPAVSSSSSAAKTVRTKTAASVSAIQSGLGGMPMVSSTFPVTSYEAPWMLSGHSMVSNGQYITV